jgi:hypothetical protein
MTEAFHTACVDRDLIGRPAPRGLDHEQNVGCLGLAVGRPWVIGVVVEVDVVEQDLAVDVPYRGDPQ